MLDALSVILRAADIQVARGLEHFLRTDELFLSCLCHVHSGVDVLLSFAVARVAGLLLLDTLDYAAFVVPQCELFVLLDDVLRVAIYPLSWRTGQCWSLH